MAAAEGVRLHHIARETSDVKRLASFYEQILGFERTETPKFGDFEVIWLKLPPFSLHLIERDPHSKLPEGPCSSASEPAVDIDPKAISRGHHLSFAVSNYDSFVKTLKEKGIKTYVKTQPDGKTKQVFFFDPDGNGLEVGSWWISAAACSRMPSVMSCFSCILRGLNKSAKIGEVGSRSFYLRQSCSSHSSFNSASEGRNSTGGSEVEIFDSRIQTVPPPPAHLFFSFIAKRFSKIKRRTKRLWRVLACITCV